MGFVFALIGAIGGSWIMSGSRAFFGFLAGMLLGWLLHRLLQAQSTIRQLGDRVDSLEQRHEATAKTFDTEPKPIVTPQRVSVYEPTPVEPSVSEGSAPEPEPPPCQRAPRQPALALG